MLYRPSFHFTFTLFIFLCCSSLQSQVFGDYNYLNSTFGDLMISEMMDIDGDGDIDYCSTTSDFDVRLMLNDGSANFSPVLISEDYTLLQEPIVSDLDGDGDLDIIAHAYGGELDPDGSIIWWENTGDLDYSEAVVLIQSAPTNGASTFDIGDIDGDGDLDIAYLGFFEEDNLKVALNDGEEQFSLADDNLGSAISSVRVDDMDGDGVAEIIAAGFDLHVYDFTSVIWPLPQTSVDSDEEVGFVSQFELADMDNDGLTDMLAYGSATFEVFAYFLDPNGTFSDRVVISTGEGGLAFDTDDLDGDGDKEVVFTGQDNGATFLAIQTSPRVFSEIVDVGQNVIFAGDLHISDIDSDGKGDLVFSLASASGLNWMKNETPTSLTEHGFISLSIQLVVNSDFAIIRHPKNIERGVLTAYDEMGRLVRRMRVTEGENKTTFPRRGLKAGTYSVHLDHADGRSVGRLIFY